MKKTRIDYRKPPYAIDSIDNALRALHMLRDSGAVRIMDVAERLEVARSTAHRIMAMLVYQGFAVQDDRQRYLAGPALSAPVVTSQRNQELVQTAAPILDELQRRTGEVVNLAVRIGVHTRVLTTIGEGKAALEDRSGRVYPAHSSSAGRAMLATEPQKLLERLYRSKSAELSGSALGDADYAELVAQLEQTRRRGFAVCDEEVERSIASVSVPVTPVEGRKCAVVLLTFKSRLELIVQNQPKIDALFDAQQALLEALERQRAEALAEEAEGR
ncbi:MAG: IclR family transcriptional regulator [Candidatus Leucobacter sulfamidivorax]|nr:IclR family transcriptional regulator [Candidatus Leucobacter sulfamidivorax]